MNRCPLLPNAARNQSFRFPPIPVDLHVGVPVTVAKSKHMTLPQNVTLRYETTSSLRRISWTYCFTMLPPLLALMQ